VAISPDGRRVVTASYPGTARVWDAATGQRLAPPLQHQGGVVHAAFSADGRRVVTASEDRTARIWDAATGQPLGPPMLHQGTVLHAAFSADGRRVVTASHDQTARVWDAATGQPLAPPLQHQHEVWHAAFSPDGRRVVTVGPTTARVWDLSPDERPTADLVLRAQLLRGQRMDQHGALVPMTTLESHAAWEALRTRYPADFTVSPEQALAWHRREVEACLRERNAPAELFHLDALIQADPADGSSYARRGQAYARLKQWDKCAADLGKGMQLGKSEGWVAGAHALALVAAGDIAGHRRACADLLQRSGQTDDPQLANDVAWVCVRVAGAVSDPVPPLKLAEKAVAAEPKDYHYLNTLGAALYRAARFQESIEKLEQAMKIADGQGAAETLFLAMAHQRLGHADEAKQWLTKAVLGIERAAQEKPEDPAAAGVPYLQRLTAQEKPEDPAAAALAWEQRLELKLLRAEAEALLNGKAPDPKR
jgi:tetratricopeptide (TPR) repeat protein